MTARLIRWAIFGVIVAILPLVFRYLWTLSQNGGASVTQMLSNGELLLISTALAASAIGEIIPCGRQYPGCALVAGGGCLSSLLFGALYYAAVSSNPPARQDIVVFISFVLFSFSLLSSAGCLIVAERSR